MKFNVGDRVVYTGRDPRINYPERIGWVGTIKKARNSYGTVSVLFDNHRTEYGDGCYGPYETNLALIEVAVDETEAFFV